MTKDEFRDHCRSGWLGGYRYRPGQTQPENYAELLGFIGERLGLDGPPFTFDALCTWLLHKKQAQDYNMLDCSQLKIERATCTLLINGLPDPDAYVASWPADAHRLFMPPSVVVVQLIQLEEGFRGNV